ncbi:MAG: polysaccharide deacetylase family protein [Spirochaetes bacterium]|nr:polysaccharide deacetylase family protein [Spirochaetota bacterium]
MKRIQSMNLVILAVVLGTALAGSMIFLFDAPTFSVNRGNGWILREKDVESRLLAVPIILYHNIDGKGPFSVTSEALRGQFSMIRDLGIRIVPLRTLINRLETRRPFTDTVMVITFDDGFEAMYSKLLPLAREFRYPVTLFVYTDNIVKRGKRSLTWEKLRELDRSGISVESHTLSHPDLTALSGKKGMDVRKKLFDEIYLSKRVLELYLGREVEMFAFPYGRYDLTLIDLCGLAGYTRVFSTDYGSNIVTRNNFCLRRQHIKNSYSIEYFISLIK